MLFNSYPFIFIFLPIVVFGFFYIGKFSHSLSSLWLAIVSLFFYGYWDMRFVGLLMGSIVFNYGAGYLINRAATLSSAGNAKTILLLSVTGNLILLCFFKYANFFSENINLITGSSLQISETILPLGISFFTFTQIAFLVDTYQGKVKEYHFIHYILFVTYFPHLIAGPILHHKEMMPQFARPDVCHINWNNIAIGLSIFVLGLSKKVLMADSLSSFASPIFNSAAAGQPPMFFEAWCGAISYTFQLYFDFSGYSDMAIGLSLMFNVRLPINFNSPYKATSIIDFWRFWHMTLSRFLRDYLYIPLGGSRNGKTQRHFNLLITMLLGGLWHGAGWTFVIWGGLHGFYLIINHAWRELKQVMNWQHSGRKYELFSRTITFTAIVFGWVFFRSDSYSSAITMLQSMIGMHGVSLPSTINPNIKQFIPQTDWIFYYGLLPVGLNPGNCLMIVLLSFSIVWLLPNVQQLFYLHLPAIDSIDQTEKTIANVNQSADHKPNPIVTCLYWNANKLQAICYGILFFILLSFMASAENSEFIYFQF